MVCPPHAKSLASDAIRMDAPFWEGHISDSKRSRGIYCQKSRSPLASSDNVTQQLKKNTELIKAYKCRV